MQGDSRKRWMRMDRRSDASKCRNVEGISDNNWNFIDFLPSRISRTLIVQSYSHMCARACATKTQTEVSPARGCRNVKLTIGEQIPLPELKLSLKVLGSSHPGSRNLVACVSLGESTAHCLAASKINVNGDPLTRHADFPVSLAPLWRARTPR